MLFAAGMVHNKHSASQVKCANIEESRQLVFDIHDTVSQGMRVLAPRSQQAGGREWQWRMPRGNLMLMSDITNFVQRGTYTMLG